MTDQNTSELRRAQLRRVSDVASWVASYADIDPLGWVSIQVRGEDREYAGWGFTLGETFVHVEPEELDALTDAELRDLCFQRATGYEFGGLEHLNAKIAKNLSMIELATPIFVACSRFKRPCITRA